MTNQNEIQQARTISELRGFIKKLLYNPSILDQSLAIARKYENEQNAESLIANDISNLTSINIPAEAHRQSAGDKLFLQLLKEVIVEEKALY